MTLAMDNSLLIYILYLQNSIDDFPIKASIKIAFVIATLDDTGGYPYLGVTAERRRNGLFLELLQLFRTHLTPVESWKPGDISP